MSTISSSKEEFDAAAQPYQAALAAAGHRHRLEYDETAGAGAGATGARTDGAGAATPRENWRRRRRNVTYFCLPFLKIVETKLGKQFLRAMDESFPVGNALHGKLNRHNIKISYSCMPNMKKRIGRHNLTVLNSETEEEVEPCVCTQYECPLDGDCGKKKVITEDGRVEYYIGSTSQTFKGRYGGQT